MTYFGVFLLLLLNCLLFYKTNTFFPSIWPDEVLFFSPAQSLVNGEGLATKVLSGLIEGMDHSTLWMPPSFFIYSSVFLKLFGSKLASARLGSFLAGLLSIFPLMGIGQKFGLKRGSLFFLSSLLFTDILYFKISSTARMESLCLFFSLLGLYLLITEISIWKKNVLSGFFLGLGFITHPFAVVFVPIALIFSYYKDSFKIKYLLQMGIGGLLPILGWAVYIVPNLHLFILQFGAQLGRKKDLLFSVFTIITKIKIILSGFKYPTYKLIILIFSTLGIVYLFNKKISNKINKVILVNVLSTIVLLFFLFLSSESWYVFYLIPFICILNTIIFEYGNIYLKLIPSLTIIYNIIILFIFLINNFYYNDTLSLQEKYFIEIYNKCHDKKKVYLQAIPDPYFYLIQKNNALEIREFIPGELPLPEDFSKEELISQDVYIFYNEDLMHPSLKKFFNDNLDLFEKSEINIHSESKIDLTFFAVVYRKK